jgi:hypothetical protein
MTAVTLGIFVTRLYRGFVIIMCLDIWLRRAADEGIGIGDFEALILSPCGDL